MAIFVIFVVSLSENKYDDDVVDNVEIKPNQVRLGEHCDYGTITLVFQLDSEGLQVGLMCYK